jgi:protocatechuate 3,4-dioxygenase beta subunit
MRRLLFLSLLLLIAAQVGFGEMSKEAKETLTGSVTDTSGAVLQGAQIQILQSLASYVSDKQGEFVVPSLDPGSYEVRITFVGDHRSR